MVVSVNKCKFQGCDKLGEYSKDNGYRHAYCAGHKKQKSRYGVMKPLYVPAGSVCILCARDARNGPLCKVHYNYMRAWTLAEEVDGEPCSMPSCPLLHYAKGVCYMHYHMAGRIEYSREIARLAEEDNKKRHSPKTSTIVA